MLCAARRELVSRTRTAGLQRQCPDLLCGMGCGVPQKTSHHPSTPASQRNSAIPAEAPTVTLTKIQKHITWGKAQLFWMDEAWPVSTGESTMRQCSNTKTPKRKGQALPPDIIVKLFKPILCNSQNCGTPFAWKVHVICQWPQREFYEAGPCRELFFAHQHLLALGPDSQIAEWPGLVSHYPKS